MLARSLARIAAEYAPFEPTTRSVVPFARSSIPRARSSTRSSAITVRLPLRLPRGRIGRMRDTCRIQSVPWNAPKPQVVFDSGTDGTDRSGIAARRAGARARARVHERVCACAGARAHAREPQNIRPIRPIRPGHFAHPRIPFLFPGDASVSATGTYPSHPSHPSSSSREKGARELPSHPSRA